MSLFEFYSTLGNTVFQGKWMFLPGTTNMFALGDFLMQKDGETTSVKAVYDFGPRPLIDKTYESSFGVRSYWTASQILEVRVWNDEDRIWGTTSDNFNGIRGVYYHEDGNSDLIAARFFEGNTLGNCGFRQLDRPMPQLIVPSGLHDVQQLWDVPSTNSEIQALFA